MSLLACQRDAYQREQESEIVACVPEGERFRLTLADSLLYPEGGGQPSDHGTIQGLAVLDVQKAEDGFVHCWTAEAVPVGRVSVVVDWTRRFDHMQQHTAQHLITALALQRLEMPTVGFHLGQEYAAIELDTPMISEEQLAQLLSWVQAAIRDAHPIRWEVMPAAAMEAEGVRSRRLPSGHEGDIRVVEIQGIDRNTCGGTHLASTAEIQAVAFVGLENIRKRVRLHFVAGERLLKRFAAQHRREQALQTMLTTPPEGLVETLERLQSEQKHMRRQYRALQQELAGQWGRALAKEAEPFVSWHQPSTTLDVLEQVARACLAESPEHLLLLTTADTGTGAGLFLVAGPPESVAAVGPVVAEVLEGRGGGRPGRYQGKAQKIEARDKVLARVASIV